MNAHTFISRTEETRDDWQTPLPVVQALGSFDLDPCANIFAPTRCASRGLTVLDDGLSQPWEGRVWCNPPYGADARKWIARLAEHGNGIALIPPRVGSKWFHSEVFERADAVFFLKGRIAFISPVTGRPVKGNNADSILVAFGEENILAIKNSGLEGVLFRTGDLK